MTIYDVGLENLPNVYVEKIKLTTSNNLDYLVVVSLVMYDSERRSWLTRPELANMKVRLVLFHDYENEYYDYYTTRLNTGEFTLDGFASDDAGYKVSFLASAPNAVSDIVGTDYDKITYGVGPAALSFSFADLRIPKTNNIALYAATYLDDFNFPNESLNQYWGPMASEIVLRNGLTNTVSGYFYFPDTNEEYSGPVHYHPVLGYMVGSTHEQYRGESHRLLRFVQIEDNKIESDFP